MVLLWQALAVILALVSSSVAEAYLCHRKEANPACTYQSVSEWSKHQKTVAQLHSNGTDLTTIRAGDSHQVNPYFFVFGFPKAGTTSLHGFTMQHPDVPAIRKEINWWMHQDNLSSESGWRRAQSQLINYFLDFPQLAESGPTGDFTIIGAICGAVPGRLQETFPAIKLIAIMREPVARAMSQFKMCTITPPTVHWPKPPFNSMSIALEVQRQFDSIQACDLKYPDMDPVDRFFSCYVAQKNVCNWGRRQYAPGCHSMVAISSYYYMIEKWRRSGFDVDQMLFLSNEDMATDAQSTMDTVFAFIGVHPHTIKVENRNVLRGTKVYDSVDLKMMKAMRTYYEPQNALLYELTGKDFGWHYTEEEKYYDAEMNGYGISETKAMDPQVIPDVRRVCERLTKSKCKEILPPKYEACKQDHEGDHNTIVGCIRRELDAFDGTKSTRKEYPPTPLAT